MIKKIMSDTGEAAHCPPRITRRSFLGLSGAAVAGGLAVAVPAATAKAGEDRATFVLIHGSWHGAWCFELVENELIDNGFDVIARDLPGHGLDAQFPSSYLSGNLNPNEVSPLAQITLDDYVNSAEQTILELQQKGRGPLIVVGHSAAGMILNELGERLGPEVIKHMVYLSGFMTPAGKTGNDIITLENQYGSLIGTLFLGSISVTGVVRVNPNSTDPTYQAQAEKVFYSDVPDKRLPAIFNLLTPDEPAAPYAVTTSITRERWGRIPRTFIRCTLDHAVPIGAQDALIQAADAFTPGNPTRIATLQSSHSSFFSMPTQLASVLMQVARASAVASSVS
jgi:pimeloyl-ACP methyl ester carboxylesterase